MFIWFLVFRPYCQDEELHEKIPRNNYELNAVAIYKTELGLKSTHF